jgi:hypothetical protein
VFPVSLSAFNKLGDLVFFFPWSAHHFQTLAELDPSFIGGMLNVAEEILSTLAELHA